MKYRSLTIAAALAGTSLVALGAFQVATQKHTLNNCIVDVSVTPVTGATQFNAYAYYEFKSTANTVEGWVSLSPPVAGKVAMRNWAGDESTQVQMAKFTENKAHFVYTKATNTMTLTLSNGSGGVPPAFMNYAFEGLYDPLTMTPMEVYLQELTPIDSTHKRVRVHVELYGLHTGYTLVDL